LDVWERIWAVGNIWLSPETDVDALLMVCQLVDEFERMRALPVGEREPNHMRDWLRLSETIARQMGDLGLNPTARSSLGVAEVRHDDPLEAFRKASS
jgi:hypothetical protein